jgi:predicted HAD superfamily Cof-like phosphohydrolase
MTLNPLKYATNDVIGFHRAFNHPAPLAPTMLTRERAALRASWCEEEAQELRDATTLVEQADAAIDGLYFNIGILVELGLDPGPLWDIVHQANMKKLHLVDGVYQVVYYPEGHPKAGKVMKPENWTDPGPELQAEVDRQITVAAAMEELANIDN